MTSQQILDQKSALAESHVFNVSIVKRAQLFTSCQRCARRVTDLLIMTNQKCYIIMFTDHEINKASTRYCMFQGSCIIMIEFSSEKCRQKCFLMLEIGQ